MAENDATQMTSKCYFHIHLQNQCTISKEYDETSLDVKILNFEICQGSQSGKKMWEIQTSDLISLDILKIICTHIYVM